MSVTYQVFMKTTHSLLQIALGLYGFTGVRFELSPNAEEELYTATVFNHWMELYGTEDFEDTKDLRFTQYQCCLSIYNAGYSKGYSDHELWHEQIAKMIAFFLARVYAKECVVLREMGLEVAMFPPLDP